MIHQNIAGNESDTVCNIVLSDKKISGTCKTETETTERKIKGTLDGKSLTWQLESDYNGTPLTITYTAKITDDENLDKFTGEVAVDPFGVSGDFSADRAK
ncbi:MAG TPA: hypothetical protein VGR47_06655 [Terracidiphilus sp.]|nr:hypothetical protein [Terracidiphilus sp.]HEV2400655.1 hypothetical protein [Candidatus Sulfotelmatobacter sp.]